MAPHQDIALATSHMIRALTLKFLERPCRDTLIRWGTVLKDRWTLPYYLLKDLEAVLRDLDDVGIIFPRDPFEAQGHFRFPDIGSLRYDGMEVRLRQALEPWPVMGEEGTPGGTVRFVDSSVERLEVMVENWDFSRYVLSCRGYQLPLKILEDGKTGVCGLRFKAWKLASGLHPTLEATPKIILDLVDLHSSRIVAGCTFWVSHPAGRNYEHPPVNAFEAESRREARFLPQGQTPGPLESLPVLVHSPEFPHTLSIHGYRTAAGNP
jgi:uncharacterized protein (DUF2126 family)